MLSRLFREACPVCKKTLTAKSMPAGAVTKYCQDGHYQKEFHPSMETYVETTKHETFSSIQAK
ncbi:hypothetical protein SAMN05192534_13912 [Alteribacillus persepolensis]|uniref:Uncharacterized protein n=1 Tax=Alteribacillus persepolensis TaxID=568899 RepID=A0A1G8K1D4_9BACI|nr:hypothetical protein [Alteribacillus persepolensis]SDI36620.1 hypothetical protein SAMN05192534_13912 [Alteribacillus persepolensis]